MRPVIFIRENLRIIRRLFQIPSQQTPPAAPTPINPKPVSQNSKSSIVEVPCADHTLWVPAEYMNADIGLKFRCQKCGGWCTENALSLTTTLRCACEFCGAIYNIHFVEEMNDLDFRTK